MDKRSFVLFGACIAFLLIVGCASEKVEEAPAVSSVVVPCATKECFISAANACSDSSLVVNETYGTFSYSSKGCVLTKTVLSLSDSEMQDMKTLLTGKSMTCVYEKGKFDDRLVNSLIFGSEFCEGELKDILAKLILFT